MSLTGLLDLEKLKRYAKEYDPVLRTLPFFQFQEFASAMKLNVVEVENEDVLVNARRKAGNTGPYKVGSTISYPSEVGKLVEMSLKPELTVCRIKDNVQNYKEKKILSNAGEKVDNTIKRHPLEKMVVDNVIIGHTEDVIFSTFFADRNDSVFSPDTAFTGFFPIIDDLKTSNDITMANKNLVPTGTFGSNDGVNDYDRLISFLRAAHPFLKRQAVLYYASEIELICKEAYRTKVNAFARPTSEDFWKAVKDDAKFPGLVPVTHEAYGSGQALILVKPGLLDLGINTKRATQYVQIRDIFEDPNEIQFWLQAAYGVRFQDVHNKVFQCNEKTNTSVDLAGDYVSGGALTVTIAGLDTADASKGQWKIGADGDWHKSGETVLGVPAGAQTIKFDSVTGYTTTPTDISVTIEDGKDYAKTGTYAKS